MFDMVDTAFSYGRVFDRLLISTGIIRDKRNYFVCDLNCVFTLGGRIVINGCLISKISALSLNNCDASRSREISQNSHM